MAVGRALGGAGQHGSTIGRSRRLGLTSCFDLVVGSSAGAINGAALIAGVAREGATTYHGPLASRSFVNPARVLRGRPVIDVNYILNFASAGLDSYGSAIGAHDGELRHRVDDSELHGIRAAGDHTDRDGIGAKSLGTLTGVD